jgi:hypothetical protein
MWSRRPNIVEHFEDGAALDLAFGGSAIGGPGPAPAPYVASEPSAAVSNMYGPSPASGPASGPAPAPLVYIANSNTPGVTSPGAAGLTVEKLRQLVTKIGNEVTRITPLAVGGDVALTAKLNNLIVLQATIQSYVTEITAGRMAIQDVRITPEEADAFLAMDLPNTNTVPNLAGSPTVSVPQTSPSVAGAYGPSAATRPGSDIQAIFAQIQDMKWRMEINYDPTFNQQKELLDRLENLERRIMSYITAGLTIPDDVKRLLMREMALIGELLTKSTAKDASSSTPPFDRAPPTKSGRTPTTAATHTTSDPRVHSVFGSGNGSGNYNEDAMIRPGFIMNDYQIQHRGSAAAFNTGVVGGLDYQKRAKDLCRQIKSAGLGDPKDFGCIENPNEVGPTYSWRGNFMMVCDRLGDTWGHWYPEMMGCLQNK